VAAVRTPQEALDAIAARPDGAVVVPVLRAHAGAWLVGGVVRDALLGRKPRELDVVVEGDPAPLIAALGGTVENDHERFGTATVRLEDGAPVDVVRARAEDYPAPGALPEVRPGTIEEDLARRDVTVNAIALGPEGGLRSVPGALDDLQRGVLRVLHDASFSDDPTRLWRLARYAARLRFDVDEHTRALAAQADPGTVSGHRLGDELRLALREPEPLAALAHAHELNARLLPPGFDPAPRKLQEALELLPPDGRADLVTLAACCGAVDAATLVRWLDDLEFPAGDRDTVAAGSRASTYAPLHAARADSEIARAARGVPLEVVALAGGDNARRWIADLRHVRLEIDGHDLLAAGVPEGPEVGRRLQQALDAKLDGGVSGRDAELAAALGTLVSE
jgi:tRNA nucleotidyltransferase (CCA-adding enzyme)